MKKNILLLLFLGVVLNITTIQAVQILNGSFSSAGSNWVTTSNFYCTNSGQTGYRTSPGYAWLALSNGTAANSIYGTLSQSFTMPSSYSDASIIFYSKITTDEVTTSSKYDIMNCTITDGTTSSTSQLKLSNLDASSSYVMRTISIPTTMAGHTLTLTFYAENDNGKPTIFRVDDVSIVVNAVVNTYNLTFTVKNVGGVARSNAAVVLYDGSYNELTTGTTNSSGQTTFSSLKNGDYNYEVYFTPSNTNLPVAANKEFWGSGTLTISGSSVSKTFTRIAPYISVGPTFSPVSPITGQQTVGSFTVKNALSYAADSYVAVWVDRDKLSSWDYSSNSSSNAKTISSIGTAAFPVNVTPNSAGTYYCYAFVYSKINGGFIITDQYNWVQSFTATDQISQITWLNHKWEVRNGTGGPGDNNWLASSSNVWVDPKDTTLHLKITKVGDKWYCAQVASLESFGFGEYTFQLNSRIDQLNPNVVFGLFTYKDHGVTTTPQESEIDIEFSTWNNEISPKNSQYVFQYRASGNVNNPNQIMPYRFVSQLNGNQTTHKFTWLEDYIHFQSYHGHYPDLPSPEFLINESTFTDVRIPSEENEQVVINLWLYKADANPNLQETEVVLKSFSFKEVFPSIEVQSPKGGEKWQIGSTQTIKWSSSNFSGNVNIQVNGNYPNGEWETIRSNTPNDGSESILITGQAGEAKRIRVISVDYPIISGVSGENLTFISPLTVYAADGSALGNRKPLLLIHGWQRKGMPADPDITLWQNFVTYYDNDQTLKDKFKLYYVRYYSNLISAADLGYELRLELDKKPEFDNKQLSIIAHSLGGLVSRAFMNRTVNGIRGGERVENLITLGTPHHGSPMANGISRYSVIDPLSANLIITFDNLIFAFNNSIPEYYEFNRSDLRWDNYDNLFDYVEYVEEKNNWLAGNFMNGDRTYDYKIVAYGGSYDPLDVGFPDLTNFSAYEIGADLMNLMFLPHIEETDGIVPFCSASFEGHLIKNIRYFKGYNHSRLAEGKNEIDQNLFGALKTDLLNENTLVSKLPKYYKIYVYLNQITGILEISKLEPFSRELKVEIINSLGQILFESKFDKIDKMISLNLSTYPIGMYIIKISSEDFFYQDKVIKK